MALDYWHRYGTDTVGVYRMIEFCKKYEGVYIYGNLEPQQMLAKYLLLAGMPFLGFIISWKDKAEEQGTTMGFPVIWPGALEDADKKGILLAISEYSYNDIVPLLINLKLTNLFFVNELNRFAIAQKMKPASKDFFWFEINIVEHCNLNCQMCDHFAPIAHEGYISIESFEKQIARMAELLCGEVRRLKLEGGEPLLHPQINEILQMSRRHFTKGEIHLYTNGILLKQWENSESGNLWKTCAQCDITLAVTEYPINIDYQTLRDKAAEYGVCYYDTTSRDENGIKYSFHHPFDLSGSQEKYHFINCFCFNNCNTLRDGKMYPCSVLPNSHHFNSYYNKDLQISKQDSIDIHKVESFEEIADFTSKPAPFCRYCNVKERKPAGWKKSERNIKEWT